MADVLAWARVYTGPLASAAVPVAGYALPVAAALVSDAILLRSHHDYPAWDAPVPVGLPLSAMVPGTVTTTRASVYPADPNRCGNTVSLAGVDGVAYTHCHLSAVAVENGRVVDAGTLLGLSGGVPGTVGAGNTTGPYLHPAGRVGGGSVCPQPLLLAIARGTPINPAVAPAAGCVTGRDDLPHRGAGDGARGGDRRSASPPSLVWCSDVDYGAARAGSSSTRSHAGSSCRSVCRPSDWAQSPS